MDIRAVARNYGVPKKDLFVHANGGGFYIKGAKIDPEVYLDKHSVVLNSRAIISGRSIISGTSIFGRVNIVSSVILDSTLQSNCHVSGTGLYMTGCYVYGSIFAKNDNIFRHVLVRSRASIHFDSGTIFDGPTPTENILESYHAIVSGRWLTPPPKQVRLARGKVLSLIAPDTVKIGCQTHSISVWKSRGKRIASHWGFSGIPEARKHILALEKWSKEMRKARKLFKS